MNRLPAGWWILPALCLVLLFGVVGLVLAQELQWDHPTTFNDGTPLSLSQIHGYVIYSDGQAIAFRYGQSSTFETTGTPLDDGQSHVVTVRTMATDSFLQSVDSNAVTVPYAGPGSPDVCVVP